jgi:hypothetical protein
VEPWVVSFYLHVRTAAEAVADLSVDDEEAMGNVQRLPLVDRIDGNRIIGAPQHVEPDDDSDVKPPIDLLAQALVPSAMTMVRSRSRRPTAPSVIINGRLSDTERTRYRVSISEDSAQSDLQVMGPSSESRMSPSSQPHTSKRRKLHHSTQPDQPDVKIPIDMTMPARPTVPLQQDTTPDVDDDLQITRPAAPNGKKSDKDRFAWPAYSDRSADEKWSIYSYFLDYAQTHLPDDLRDPPDPDDPSYEMDVDTGARVGAVEQVPNELDDEIIQVWAEARRRYTRRNLDHLSIMLSTWATGRVSALPLQHFMESAEEEVMIGLTSQRLNLAPMALRAFYDKHKSKIRVLAGPYVPVQARPPGFPWHEEQPVDPEGLIGWIPDWGQPGCAAFTGWDDGQQETD